MNIKLRINGEEKTFTQTFIKARMLRKVLGMQHSINFEDMSASELDEVVGVVVEAYDKQFTVDQFYDGLTASEMMGAITDTFDAIADTGGDESSGEKK